jgi:competence protein ComEC
MGGEQREGEAGWRLAGLALAWLLGVALHLQLRSLWPLAACVAVCAGGALGLGAAWVWRRAIALGLVGVFALGFGASGWRASLRLDDALPAALEGRDLAVTGIVATLPQRSAAGLRFRFDVERAQDRDGAEVHIPETLALGWYSGYHEDAALTQPQTELRAGQRWRFTLRLRQPHGNLNPNGFDYELNLFEQGVRATGYVRDAPAPQLLHRAAGYPLERLRQRVRDAIDASVPDRRAAGLLAALAVGDQGAIERDDWALYRNTGIAHLVSISGLHITMFAWLAGAAIAALWRRSARASLHWPAPLAARWGGLACAFAYALFSGWGVPSQRTIWMLATVTALQTLGVRWPWPLVLLLAAVVVTLGDPWALLQAGFWLSFAAVGLLMASSPVRAMPGDASSDEPAMPVWRATLHRLIGGARDGIRAQLVATLGLAPLSLVFFQQISIVGFVANLMAIPAITLVITPLALLGVALVPLWSVGAGAVGLLNAALSWLAGWPGAVWSTATAPFWAQLGALLGAALLMLPLPRRARLLGAPLLLALVLPPRAVPAPGAFELIAVDIGQGTAVLLRTHSHLLVFDAGPQYSRESDAGQRVLLPLLRSRGETRIDRLVLSHRDLDHVGGARALLDGMPVDDLLSSLEPGHALLAQASAGGRTTTTRCETGQAWDWDGVHFELLWPPPDAYARVLKSNAMSCVVRVTASLPGASPRGVLLTGDIERDQEAQLVQRAPDALRSDVLIAPHHGSRTSSSAAFLDAVRPRVAVFQAGYRNRFGHPAPDVLERYRERGIRILASPACGAWRSQMPAPADGAGDDALDGICERDAARRYWQHRVDVAEDTADAARR